MVAFLSDSILTQPTLDLTDAFMGIACLAAVAKGTTRITGIANQRVKECNRIRVMVEELTKCGINSRELEDGIEIEGKTEPISLPAPVEILCYNDHRIAMSFACLGARVPGIIITDKECVQKTYPEFWDDISNVLGAQLRVPGETYVFYAGEPATNTILQK